ncbi:MAG: restriction endonuclease subunit S [Muribaculaceae bacterium]|nr:restriction endonuclease subunit S [Muribaculaceae bacterium]
MEKYTLRQLLKIKNGRDHKELLNGAYPVYGSGGIMRYVDTYLYDKQSILLPRKGTLNNIQYADSPFWSVDTIYYTEIDNSLVDPYYLYNYLRLLDLSNLDSGTGVPSMTFDSYYNIKVNLPSQTIQVKVANVLKAIDKKIDINREINRNLEAMARQLYDYWFVQFDFPDENGRPYKSSGGKMVWNEKLKREIPEGWEVNKIVNIEPNIITGKTPSTSRSEYFGGDIPFVTIEDIRATRFVRMSNRTLTDIGANTQSKKYLPYGSLMCSCIGTVGVMGFCGCVLQTNQQINSIVFTNYRNAQYIFFALEEYFKSADAKVGNILPNMSKQEFGEIPIVYPTSQIITKFAELSRSCFEHISRICEEIEVLTRQRDELLPLLMNGQVSVMLPEVNCDLSPD